jgi:hypothetical protein
MVVDTTISNTIDWIQNDNLWIYGRTERLPPGDEDIRPLYRSLISINYVIAKKKTSFLHEIIYLGSMRFWTKK